MHTSFRGNATMILPRTTMIGLGLSAASLATGGFLTKSTESQRAKPEWGAAPNVHLPGAALAGAGAIGAIGFGLGSSMPGMRPVGAMVAAMLGATILGFGAGAIVDAARR